MKKKIIFASATVVLLSLLIVATGCSVFGTDDSFDYKDTDGGKTLYRYEGNSSHLSMTVPDETSDGEPIVELSDFSVAAAEYLQTVSLGKNIRKISSRAFCGSTKLQEINVDSNNPYYCSVGGVLYNKDCTELICYPNARMVDGAVATEFTVPETVTKINSCAFYMCDRLEKLTLGSQVVEVESNACMKCTSLKELNLNEGLKTVGKDAFSFTESLSSLTLPSTLEKIDDYAFYAKSSKMESFITKKPIDQIECGKSWKPQRTGMESSAIEPEYQGGN